MGSYIRFLWCYVSFPLFYFYLFFKIIITLINYSFSSISEILALRATL